MQQEPTHNALKKTSLVIGGILLTAAIAFGVVFLLKNITPKANNSLTPNHVAEVAPQEVIKSYNHEAITGLGEEAYMQQNDENAVAYVIYKSGNHDYTVQAPTKLDVMFVAKSQTQPDDRQTITEQTTAFMTSKGYDEINNTGSASGENPSYYTYASGSAVCQLTSARPIQDAPASTPYYGLACIDKKEVEQEYTEVEKLLELYKQSQALPSFTEVSRNTISEGNKMLAILSLSGGDGHPSLLFASVDDNWSYIGDLNAEGTNNGKYSLSPAIQVAIKDPQYGDFLKKNIGR